MMLRKTLFILVAGALLVAGPFGQLGLVDQASAAEIFPKVGTYGAQFLKLGPTARATGMGSAYTAVADNVESVYWNPAGIVSVRGNQVLVSQTEWTADINLSFFAMVFNPRSIDGTFAISARALWMDSQLVRTATEPDGNGQLFDSGSQTVGLTYSRFFTDKFSAGATLHYLHSSLADFDVNTAVADIGILYRIGIRGMKIGMSIQSLGAEVTYDERPARMPTMFKVGFAMDAVRVGRQRLIAATEFEHPVDNTERANFGAEYNMGFDSGAFFLRGGYSLEYDTQGLSAGAGFRVNTGNSSAVDLDYSWVDMAALGFVHRVGLMIGF
ncbi:hypothetical protein DRQ53_04960 [bacterium]|nr:MAG: hypothetical protein DRQ53_04960 [bacterium]